MYIPNIFQETDTNVLHSLIKSHPLGTWATIINDELEINHIPFIFDGTIGKNGALKGHVNRANPVWKSLNRTKNSIVVFQGPETYITPSWYPSKIEHEKVVPTWNYVVVHVHGIPQAIEDENWLLDQLNALTNGQESNQTVPWKVSDAPDHFIDSMIRGIVGIEIPVDKILGSWKTSQNRPQSDKLGVITGLKSQKDSQSLEMASYVNQHFSPKN